MNQAAHSIPTVSVNDSGDGRSTRPNEPGMRPMRERVYQKRGERYLLIKSQPASGKSRALMCIALESVQRPRRRQQRQGGCDEDVS
jgi:hypothetical protein